VGTTSYTYDALGNLVAATLPDGTALSYVIDAQNRRVGKKVNGTMAQGFLYQSQLAPVAELNGSNQVVSRFVYGTRANVPDYMVKGGVTYRLISDHLGSVRLVVNAATGAVAQRIDYDEYGRVTQNTAAGFQPFGYAGGLLDSHTGLTRFGARDYDPQTGRWTAKNPIGFGGGYANLYEYVDNDPINHIDPTGLQALDPWVFIYEYSGLRQFGVPFTGTPGPGVGSAWIGIGGVRIGTDGISGTSVVVGAGAQLNFPQSIAPKGTPSVSVSVCGPFEWHFGDGVTGPGIAWSWPPWRVSVDYPLPVPSSWQPSPWQPNGPPFPADATGAGREK